MCGIIGYSSTVLDEAGLARGLSAISHRGPDDHGIFVDSQDGIGLGHARLSILDVSQLGHQPMLSADGNVVLIYNGEIYNFRELRSELKSRGCSFVGTSDSEVLLMLYLVHGTALLEKLNGIFAFAIWDKRSGTLFLARDALGVKPLYYATSAKGFSFSSEIKGLLKLDPSLADRNDLDMLSLHRYLSFLWCPGEGTPLRSVKKLNPGEAMLVKQGNIAKRWSWYQLPVFRETGPQLDKSYSIYGAEANLRQAVQRQLVADVPVGAFLSGGLDSSSVVAMAKEQAPDIQCFSIDIVGAQEAGVTDDLPYARRVAKYLDVDLHVVQVNAQDMAQDLELMVSQLDEPLADPACLNVLYISRLAREHGIKVLLSGNGGDDLFAGYRRHQVIRYESLWRWMPKAAQNFVNTRAETLDKRDVLFRRLSKVLSGAGLEGNDRLVNYFFWTAEKRLYRLYTPEFAEQVLQQRAAQPMLDFLSPLRDTVPELEKLLALDQRYFLSDHNLNYTDKMSMATGVEVRVPFLDQDLVEFAAQVPDQFKLHLNHGKWVLRQAMARYLPEEILHRPKTGFGAPLRRWIQHDLRSLMLEVLSRESLKKRGLFVPEEVHRLIAENDRGIRDSSYTLLSLMCIEIWCRSFLDKAA